MDVKIVTIWVTERWVGAVFVDFLVENGFDVCACGCTLGRPLDVGFGCVLPAEKLSKAYGLFKSILLMVRIEVRG